MLIPNKFNGYSADGIRLYNCDGGSSGASSTPSAVTQTSLSYSPEVQPLVNQVLAESAGLAQQQ